MCDDNIHLPRNLQHALPFKSTTLSSQIGLSNLRRIGSCLQIKLNVSRQNSPEGQS